jgi:hypothetical protein
MTYSVSNPPALVSGPLTGPGKQWVYRSTDPASSVDVAGYFTNGDALGMEAGDTVLVIDSDASPIAVTSHVVAAVTAGGSADLSEGVAVSGANTD